MTYAAEADDLCACTAEADDLSALDLCAYVFHTTSCCGVATISRLLKITGLFYRISSLLLGSFAKETYDLKEPTNGRQRIGV